jgi:hypothetical protein
VNLLQGDNLFCFALSAARASVPSVLGGVLDLVSAALAFFDEQLGDLVNLCFTNIITAAS